MTQLSQFLNLGVSDATIEKWEQDISQPSEAYRTSIVEFLGSNSEPTKAAAESCADEWLEPGLKV